MTSNPSALHVCTLPPFPAVVDGELMDLSRHYVCPECDTRWIAAKRFINRQPQMRWNESGQVTGRPLRVEMPSLRAENDSLVEEFCRSSRTVDIDDVLLAFNEFCGDEDLRLVNQYNENVISTDFESLIKRFIAYNRSRFVL